MLLTRAIILTRVRKTFNDISLATVTKETWWAVTVVMIVSVMTGASMETRIWLTFICVLLTTNSMKSCRTATRKVPWKKLTKTYYIKTAVKYIKADLHAKSWLVARDLKSMRHPCDFFHRFISLRRTNRRPLGSSRRAIDLTVLLGLYSKANCNIFRGLTTRNAAQPLISCEVKAHYDVCQIMT